MTLIPKLETERLSLHGHRVEDFADSAALWADRDVTRYIGGQPFNSSDSWARLLRHVGHWELLGFGYWVVRERATGQFIGEVGFANLKRELAPPFGDTPEAGWVVSPAVHGRGFATEAMRAAIAWRDRHLAGARTVCMIEPENSASLRVAAKLGFNEFARTEYKGVAMALFERRTGN